MDNEPPAYIPAAGAGAFGDLSGGSVRPADRPEPFEPADADPRETYRKKCPACGSTKVRVLIPAGENDNLFNPSNFRVFQDRQCQACGRKWTPACPPWAAYFCAAAGALLVGGSLAGGAWCVSHYGTNGLWLGAIYTAIPATGGTFALVYGLGALRGTLGRLRMR